MKSTSKTTPFHNAKSFFHHQGLRGAWIQAQRFAKEDGRLATLPDIIAARELSEPDTSDFGITNNPWSTYFTTLSAEYCGISKQTGRQIIIVAHGVGPMATLEGVERAYSWEYKHRSLNHTGGRISREEFWDLEAGKFGEVSVVDLEEYRSRYPDPFERFLSVSEARKDPLLRARFGVRVDQYIDTHERAALQWNRTAAANGTAHLCADPLIIKVGDAENCPYLWGPPGSNERPFEDGKALAHLISVNSVSAHSNRSLRIDTKCHEWWHGVRLVGIRSGTRDLSSIPHSMDAQGIIWKYWRELFFSVPKVQQYVKMGFRALMLMDSVYFTQYPKRGESVDTWEPEYRVKSAKHIGKPVEFRTASPGPHSFNYGISEVEAIAPAGANAYRLVSEPKILFSRSTDQGKRICTCMVQFVRVEVDFTKRLIRHEELARDVDRMMRYIERDK